MSLIDKIQAKHNLILKLLLVVAVSFLFAFLLPPTHVDFHDVDEFDAVWPYKDLIVNDEFSVKKSNEQLLHEKNQLAINAPLVFTERPEAKSEKWFRLKQLANNQFKNVNWLVPFIDSIYSKGIVEAYEGAVGKIVLINKGGVAEYELYNKLYTINSASKKIEGELAQNGVKAQGINWSNFLAETIFFDTTKTNQILSNLSEGISVYSELYGKGDKLIAQGEQLTKQKRDIISAFFKNKKNAGTISFNTFLGRWGLMFLLSLTLLMYLYFFRKAVFGKNLQVLFLYLCLATIFSLTYFFYRYGLMLTALPFVLIPIIVRAFFDGRTALFTHLISVLSCSFFMPDVTEFLFTQLITGIGILFSISEMRKRQQIVNAAVIAVVFYCLIFMFYNLGFGTKQLLFKVSAYLPYFISAALVLLAAPIIFIIEKLFGFISDFKLLELSDLNHPLLRELSQQVPGTFQHSLQVANLAEEAIYFIGGNTLLIRAGAMYHDVGKIYNPGYFIENQGGKLNPHIEMQPKESAKIIINHVIKGIELAKKYNLPEQVIDFIRTHHGTTTVGFFLTMQRKEEDKLTINEDDFKYPGPIPFSKETAVLMLADGVEAASRSLKKHDGVTISDLVDQIIDYKINQGQLMNADITFKDITLIKKIFKKRLMTIYHARIEYPT